jgi:PAS domain S-box-containing protein
MGQGGICVEERILDSLGFGVMVIGRWSREIHAFNRRMEEIAGISADEALGRQVAEVFAHISGLDLEAIDAEIRAKGGFEARSLEVVRPSGDVVYRHLRGDVLDAAPGEEEAVVVSVSDITEQEWTRQCLTRYVSRDVAELLLARRGQEAIRGEEVEIAVLVADMREFTATAEGLTPEELFATVNAYLEKMVGIVIRNRGSIDKFTGDGFMAVFGAPSAFGDEARRALTAALELREAVSALAAERSRDGLPALELGYSIHWGPALAGSLGNLLRMEYTVIGDTVNVAHRIQSLAEPGEIYATAAAAAAAGEGLAWDEGRWVRVRGRKGPVKVQRLLGWAAESPPRPEGLRAAVPA